MSMEISAMRHFEGKRYEDGRKVGNKFKVYEISPVLSEVSMMVRYSEFPGMKVTPRASEVVYNYEGSSCGYVKVDSGWEGEMVKHTNPLGWISKRLSEKYDVTEVTDFVPSPECKTCGMVSYFGILAKNENGSFLVSRGSRMDAHLMRVASFDFEKDKMVSFLLDIEGIMSGI